MKSEILFDYAYCTGGVGYRLQCRISNETEKGLFFIKTWMTWKKRKYEFCTRNSTVDKVGYPPSLGHPSQDDWQQGHEAPQEELMVIDLQSPRERPWEFC